jgi:RNA polymerase sigma-70 factor (sigma-E family)
VSRDGTADEADFELFVAVRSQALMRTAYLLAGSVPAAEDLMQTTFEKVYPRWHRIKRMDNPDAYVRRILVNLGKDGWRARRRGEESVELADDIGGFGVDHSEQVAQRDRLMRALAELPDGMRTVVVLRYWEDLSVQEVADLLRCSVGNVKAQSFRGLNQLKHLVGSDMDRRLT